MNPNLQTATPYQILMAAAGQNPKIGAVEILNDPAVQAAAQNPTRYQDKEYTKSDDIHLGISSGSQAGLVHPSGTSLLFTAAPSEPFKPHAFIIPSSHSWQLYIQQISIGAFNAIDGDNVPAESHSEVSLSQGVSWPTIQTAMPIKITMFNGASWDKRYALDLRGTRLRD